MTFSIKRFNALFLKELQDLKSNITYLVICFLPMSLSIIYKMVYPHDLQRFWLVFTTIMSIAMIGVSYSAGTFAEEKEKHTLSVLMLSPISELEIILGKTFVTYLLILISSFGNLLIYNSVDINILMYIIVVSLAGYGAILFGIAIGMVSPNEKASGVLSFPAFFIYLIPILFTETNNVVIIKIISIFPSHNMLSILAPDMLSGTANSTFLSFLFLVMWIVVGFIFFIVIYRKKKLN